MVPFALLLHWLNFICPRRFDRGLRYEILGSHSLSPGTVQTLLTGLGLEDERGDV